MESQIDQIMDGYDNKYEELIEPMFRDGLLVLVCLGGMKEIAIPSI